MKAKPKMARLMEKAGFTLQRNNRIPPPPAVCEEWWRQAEDLIKRKHKARPKFGLGYINLEGSDEEEEGSRVTCHATFVSSEDDTETSHRGLHRQSYHNGDPSEVEEELGSTSAPLELEDGGQPTVDELVEVNLGTEDDPRPTFVSATLTEEEREGYRCFLMEYRDCFAWNYKEMPGLDPRVATHKLAIDPYHRPPASIGALLAQHNDEGKEVACYYLSRTMVGAERNYSPIEKLCLALIFSLKKLRHYMLALQIQLVARADPIRYVLSQPALMGRLGKWALLMMEFDLTFVPQKAIKGQALADFLAAHPVPEDSPLITNLPDEEAFTAELEGPWELYFDGASRTEANSDGTPRRRAGTGLVFKTPRGEVMYHSFSLLKEECSNNEAEYEALIFGLLLALSMDVRSLRAYGDSQLIVRQVNGIYEVRKPELVPYYNAARNLMGKFLQVEVLHVPRSRNAPADALAKLAAALVLPDDKSMQVTVEERWLLPAVLELIPPEYEVNTITTNVVDEDEWLQPFLDYFKHGSLPDDPVKRRQLQRRLPSYVYKAGVLYKRSHGQEILLRCVNRGEAEKILQEMHHGVCGGHQGGAKMYHGIRLAGYYWPDNAKAFKSKKMYRFMAKYKIKWNYSTGYYPQANGAIEAFNKTLGKVLKKTVTRNRRDWHDRLFESLWAYRVTVRTPTQSTPYSLVYGSEAVLPLEVQLPSLRVAIQDELTKDEQIHLRFQELDALEEERLYALQNLELYRQNMVRAYDKLVKHRVFRKGELVLVLRRPIVVTHKTKGKFEPKWEGPYAIEQVYDGGAYQLVDSQGSRPMPPINGRFLKKYFC
ncbi:hypothetical protein ACQ4PT_026069 [Festuca glaucescens]